MAKSKSPVLQKPKRHNGAPKGNKFALGNHGGVPPTYTKEWLAEEAKRFLAWMDEPESIYFKSFAIERGYSPQRLVEFADKSNEFAEAYKIAKEWQEQKLVSYGLFNKTNASMTKFVLGNCHAWAEHTQVSGDAANPLEFLLKKVDGGSKELVDDQAE